MFVNGTTLNEQSLQRTYHKCFLTSFISFGPAVLEEKIFQKSTNQKQEFPVVAMFVNESERNVQSLQRTFHGCFLPSFGLFGYTVSKEKLFKKSTKQKQELPVPWQSYLSTDGDEMSNPYRLSSIDASYQVSVHLAKRFQRRRFCRNQPIRNKNCL